MEVVYKMWFYLSILIVLIILYLTFDYQVRKFLAKIMIYQFYCYFKLSITKQAPKGAYLTLYKGGYLFKWQAKNLERYKALK